MTRSKFRARRLTTATATLSLAVALSLTVSHDAMAACPSAAPTAGDDNLTCNDSEAAANIDLGGGNDKFVVDGGSMYTGGTTGRRISGDVGDDLIIVKDGQFYDIRGGNTAANANDHDRIFVFGGTAVRAELQSGAGDHPFIFFMGGTITATDRGSMEIRAGSVGATLVIDGGQLLGNGEFEIQNASGALDAAKDVTVYFRSGIIETSATEEIEGNSLSNTFIFDPVNSQDKAYYEGIADAAANGSATSLSTGNLNAALFNAEYLTQDEGRKMILRTPEVDMAEGDDTLIFDGAVNTGDEDDRNLVLQGEQEGPDDFEITEFNGGDGVDSLTVKGASRLALGELESFENLSVTTGSILTLGEKEYEFEESVTVDGTSVLHLSGANVMFETEHFELQAGDGLEALAGLPSYYNAFATGGVLRIGALPGATGGDDEDDDDFAALDADDGDDEGSTGEPVNVEFHVGGNTFVNNGTITMLNGVVGDNLTVVGPYTSTGGNLAVDTELGGAGSPTDLLSIQGTVAGVTTIYVNNVGGTGAATGPDGIVIAASDSGAFAADSFRLAVNALSGKEEVVAGAYSYRLSVTDDDARLQSGLLDQVPAYATAPSVGQRLVAGGLDTLYKRLGEIRSGHSDGATNGDGLVWVRGHYSDMDVDAKQGFDFSQRTSGVLFGLGGTIATEGKTRLAVGAFGGYSTADAGVDAVIFGANSGSSVDAESWSFGGYATYYEHGRAGTGLYVDAVVKADFIDFDMTASNRASRGSSDGDAFTGSAEVGYGIPLGGGIVVQPQAQVAYTDLTVNAFNDANYGLAVSYGASESLVGRLGLQIQANWAQPGGGYVSPYAIVNVYEDFEGGSVTDVNGAKIASDIGGTWYSLGGGVNAQLANNVSLYGSGEYHFGDLEGWQGTGGVKLNW